MAFDYTEFTERNLSGLNLIMHGESTKLSQDKYGGWTVRSTKKRGEPVWYNECPIKPIHSPDEVCGGSSQFYLKGEEVSFSQSEFSYNGIEYGIPGATGDQQKDLNTFAAHDSFYCQDKELPYLVERKSRFKCDGKWKFVSLAPEMRITIGPLPDVKTMGVTGTGFTPDLIKKLPTCASQNVEVEKWLDKKIGASLSGVFESEASPGSVKFNISNTEHWERLSFDANGFQKMKGALMKTGDTTFEGGGTHSPGVNCVNMIPFDIKIDFQDPNRPSWQTVIKEDGCGVLKGQIFSGFFKRIK
jgi:hypothetical protein